MYAELPDTVEEVPELHDTVKEVPGLPEAATIDTNTSFSEDTLSETGKIDSANVPTASNYNKANATTTTTAITFADLAGCISVLFCPNCSLCTSSPPSILIS